MATIVTWVEISARMNDGKVELDVFSQKASYEDPDMADVMFNNKVDELCPVYLRNDNNSSVFFYDQYDLLPLYQWVQGTRSLEDMFQWREEFGKKNFTPYMRGIVAALEKLDKEIMNYVPGCIQEEVHSYGLPEQEPIEQPVQQKKPVYQKYAVRYQHNDGNIRTKYYDSHMEAVRDYMKLVEKMKPTVAIGYNGNEWVKLCEANK